MIKTIAKRENIKHKYINFYTGLLITKLYLVCQGNLSLTCTILKDLHNPQDYTFKIWKIPNQDSWIAQESQQAQQDHTCKLGNPLANI